MNHPSSPRRRAALKSWRSLKVAGLAIAVLSGPIQAATLNWNNGMGTDMWTEPFNWDLGSLPLADDIAQFNATTGMQTIDLGGSTQEVLTLNFAVNTTSNYALKNGSLILNNINQTQDDPNQVQATVTITTKNSGADILNSNVTANQLQLQGKVTAGGLIKTGAGDLRLGTSGTAFDNAINGNIVINGGTLTAAAASTDGVNNPLGGTGNVTIGISGVTLRLTAQTNYDFVREVVANNNSFTINAAASTGDPGDFQMTMGKISIGNATLTATAGNGYQVRTKELALAAGATTTINTPNGGQHLLVNALSGDSTTKIVKTGAADLRILGNGTNATTFAGDIDHAAGWLVLENLTGQPLGNANTQINITASTPTVSLRSASAFAFDGININAGNNSFNLDVRRLSGTATNQVLTANGTVTIGNATMSVTGDQGFTAVLDGLSVLPNSNATIGVNNNAGGAAQTLRINKLSGDATTTITRTGGQSFTISAANNNFAGTLAINGTGTNQIEGSTGNSPLANAAGIVFLTGANLNLRSAESLDFVAPISFGPNVTSASLDINRLGSSASGQTLTVGELTIGGGNNFPNGATRTLTINGGNSYTFASDGVRIGAGEIGALTTNTINVTIGTLVTGAGSTFIKQGGSQLTITADNSATSSANILLRAGTIVANTTGALGSGAVTVGNTTPNTAGFLPDQSRLRWGAAGATVNSNGVDATAIAGGVIDLDVAPGADDKFAVQADGRIQGDASQLSQLTVGTNLTLSPGAIISHDNPGSTTATVQGLTNDANLFYGLSANAATLPTIGVNTPWKGISSDNTAARLIQGANATDRAVININGGDGDTNTVEATFQGMFNTNLEFNSNYTFASTNAEGKKVTLAIRGTLGTGFGLVPGGLVILRQTAASTGLDTAVDKIIVQNGGLSLSTLNGLNGVPVEVQNNGVLDIGSIAGNIIDGPVTFKSGGTFVFNDNQKLTGTGVLTFESGSKLDINGAPATFFDDATEPMNFSSNHTVRFSANDISNLDAKIPDAGVNFVITGGAATTGNFPETNIATPALNTQSAGLTLENGVLTNDTSNRAFSGPIRLNNTNLTVAATRSTSFIVTSPISTTGNVQVGSSTPIDNRDKSNNSGALNGFGMPDPFNSGAQVIFTGTFAAKDVTAVNSQLNFTNADTTISGDLSITGGVLYLDGGGNTAGTQGQLTGKLAAGTLASRILLNNYTRAEMKLDLPTDGSVLEINTPFVISGEVNPQDNRRMWVSRNNTVTNTRVDFNNVTLMDGSSFALDEDNTDIRVAFKIAGNTTIFRGGHDDFDFLSLTRDVSLPAFNGTNPAVVTLGRINQTGIQGFNNTISNVFGPISSGLDVNIVRGQLFLQPTATVDGVIRTHTALAGGDSLVVSTSNGATADTTIGGAGRIELGRSAAANDAEDFEIRGTEVAAGGTAPLHTHDGLIRVVDDGTSALDGIIRAGRHNDNSVTARVAVTNVEIANNATAQFTSTVTVPLSVGSITLEGNGTINTPVAGMTYGTINAGPTKNVSFTGTGAPTVNSSVQGKQVSIASGTFNDVVTAADALSVNSGTFNATVSAGNALGISNGNATFAGNVTAASTAISTANATFRGNLNSSLNLTGGAATFDPGFGVTATISGPVTMDGAGTIAVSSGTLDLGNNPVTASSLGATVAGLREMKASGAFNETSPNLSNVVKLGPVMGQLTTGWGTNETYVYTGQFFVPDNNGNGTGTFAFAENFDDSVRLVIDGTQRLRNTAWNDATGTGALTLSSGWHDIEIRFGQGTGGAGPNNNDGWNTTLGFGIDLNAPIDSSTGSPVQAQYVAPLDNGSMNLFRTTTNSTVAVGDSATLNAGGLKNVGKVTFSGFSGVVNLNSTGAAVASTVGLIEIGGSAGGNLNIVRAEDSLTVENLNLAGSLDVTGRGKLMVTGVGTGTANGMLSYSGEGSVVMNGSIVAPAIVNSGRVQGNGNFAGGLTVNGGVLAPGDGIGSLKTGNFDLGTFAFLVPKLSIEIAGSTAGTGYDQIVTTGTVSLNGELQGSLLNGFIPTTGDIFYLILNDDVDPVAGTFVNLAENSTVRFGGIDFKITYLANGDGGSIPNDVALIAQIPEPNAAAMLVGSFGMLLGLQRFRRRAVRG